jgi:FG-GAP repeat
VTTKYRSRLSGWIWAVLMLLGGCTRSPLPASDDGPDDTGGPDDTDDGPDDTDGSDDTGGPHEPDGPPQIQQIEVHAAPIKRFVFEWLVDDAQDYELLEQREPDAAFEPVAAMLGETGGSLVVPLHLRAHASYMLRACNDHGCSESEPVELGAVEPAIGFIKSPAPRAEGQFGAALALSGDGRTLAVREFDDVGIEIFDIYVLDSDSGTWSFDATISSQPGDGVFDALALAGDGRTLVLGAQLENSDAIGIGGDPNDESALDSGAVYVYERGMDGSWTLAAYVKASNADPGDRFGGTVAIDRAGDTLVVGAQFERSFPAGENSDPSDDSEPQAGAVYVFERGMDGTWTEQHYLKEPTYVSSADQYGRHVQLDAAGQMLIVSTLRTIYTYARVGETWELDDTLTLVTVPFRSPILSPDGERMVIARPDWDVDGVFQAGDVTVYRRAANGGWDVHTELVAPNPGPQHGFGDAIAFDSDGRLLLIGSGGESSPATGVDGSQIETSSERAGAAYLFERDVDTDEWTLRSYLKASNTGSPQDLAEFGCDVAMSDDGETLAIGAEFESSAAAGVQGVPEPDADIYLSGAVYLF